MRLTSLRSRLALAGGCALAALGGMTAASALSGDSPVGDTDPAALDAVPGSAVIDARADDPDPSRPRWAVRAYDGRTGLSCLEVGRTDGTRFGPLDPDGTIVDTAPHTSGTCADLDADVVQLALARRPASAAGPARSVYFGRAATTVGQITGEYADRTLPIALGSERRTFLVVLDGVVDPAALTVAATLVDGGRRDFALGDAVP